MLEDFGIGLLILVAVGIIAAVVIALLVRRGYRDHMARKVVKTPRSDHPILKTSHDYADKEPPSPRVWTREGDGIQVQVSKRATRKTPIKIEPTISDDEKYATEDEITTDLEDDIATTTVNELDNELNEVVPMRGHSREPTLEDTLPSQDEITIHPLFLKEPDVETNVLPDDKTVLCAEGAAVPATPPPSSAIKVKSQVSPACPEHIVMRVMADKEQPFIGYELLQALLSAGFRFGKMNIFHFHDDEAPTKPILFSLASATEPGTFDLSNIGAQVCEGLTVFLTVDNVDDPAAVFERMLTACQQLVDDLGGTLYDAKLKPLTETSLDEWRSQLAVELT